MRIVNLKNPSYHYRQKTGNNQEKASEENYYGDAPDSFWNSNRPAGRHLGADARLLAKGRWMGLRLPVVLRPLLSDLRARPDWTMHGELDAARRTQPAHQARAHRRAGQWQHLSQSMSDREDGRDARPDLRRPAQPRDRRRMVRARAQ